MMADSTDETAAPRWVWWGSIVFAVLFLSWAYFQRNDPDVALWASAYGLGALFSVLYLVDRLSGPLAGSYGLAIGAYSVYLAFRVIGQQPIFEEQGREMFGGFVLAAWMLVLYRYAHPIDVDRRGP